VQQCIHYACRFLRSCRQKPHLHCLNSYNWPFEGKDNADMALSEKEFDNLLQCSRMSVGRDRGIWLAVKWWSAFLLILWLYTYFPDLLFFIVMFFYFEVFDNFHVFTINWLFITIFLNKASKVGMLHWIWYTQNRRQKVFKWGLLVCAGGLDIIKIDKTPLIHNASYFNLGWLGALLRGAKSTKSRPWRRDCDC